MITKTAREAADFHRVTVDTVRTWCRMGAVRATKQAGRWIIEAASLTRRAQWAFKAKLARKARAERPTQKKETMSHWDSDHPEIATLTKAVQVGVTPEHIADAVGPNSLASGRPFSRSDERKVNNLIAAATRHKGGWSKASRRRQDGYVATFMEDLTGATSPAKPGQCHFCGLSANTCDCR